MTPYGVGIVPSNSNMMYYGSLSNTDLDTTGNVQGFLMAFIASPSASNNIRQLLSVRNTTTAHVGVVLDSANAFKLIFGTSGNVTPNIIVPELNNQLIFVAARLTDARQVVYANGKLIHDATASYAWGNDTTVGEYTQSSEQRAPLLLKLVWSGADTPNFSELQEYSSNPWQIFKPLKRVFYFDVPSSFPVLSSLSVSNITSSGGRLTVN